ncbi:MAG TPA: hypothetical protein VKV25_08205, partial [Acidimicrobiales bacterium]|nr:hypothetical protein [Acidimicrobiales bacterium]
MGAGSKITHTHYVVAPAAPVPVPAPAPEAIEAFEAAVEAIGEIPDPLDDGGYDAFVAKVEAAKAALAAAADAGAPAQLVAEESSHLKHVVSSYLNTVDALSTQSLEAIAEAAGFQHPGLVGKELPEGKTHPLVAWLNPLYPPDAPYKAAIQAKALERLEQLQAGGTYAGMTYQDYLLVHPPQKTLLSPQELDDLHSRIVELGQHGSTLGPAELLALKQAYHTYIDAGCTDPAYVKKVTGGLACFHATRWLPPAQLAPVADQLPQYGVSAADAMMLASNADLDDYLYGTPEQKHLAAKDLDALKKHVTTLQQHACLPAVFERVCSGETLFTPGQVDSEATDFFDASPALMGVLAHRNQLDYLFHPTVAPLVGLDAYHAPVPLPSDLSSAVRAWAKTVPLGKLRDLAAGLGMEQEVASSLPRAALQNWLCKPWDAKAASKFDQAVAAHGAKAQQATATKATATKATATKVAAGPALAKKAAASQAAPGGFAERKSRLFAGLKHLASSVRSLPARPSAAEVATLELHPIDAPVTGGAHTKYFYADSKGRQWMFKPSSPSRAVTEQVAAEMLHRVGMPAVPVYAHQVGSKTGSIQPLVAHSGTIPPDPASWSQDDVDAMVRLH